MTVICLPAAQPAPGVVAAVGEDARVVDGLPAASRALADLPGETLVVVGSTVDLAEALAFTARQRWERPAVGVVLIRDRIDVGVLSEALRAGVREVVRSGDLDALAEACHRSQELSRHVPGSPSAVDRGPQGRILTVFSTKGGCGKTTLATNLAVALQQAGRRVCLVDLDLSFGDVAISLQLAPERTVVDAVAMADRMDATGVSSLLTPWRPGLDCVLAPVAPGDADKVPAPAVAELLRVLREMFDHVLVDTPAQFSEHVLVALDASDQHVLLTTPDVPALKNLRLTLDMLDLLSYEREGRSVVLNRADSRVGLTVADVERAVRSCVDERVPSSRDVPAATNRGVPIVADQPKHAVSVAIRRFAQRHVLDRPAAGPARLVLPTRSTSRRAS
ncbi:MAG TPA: AAA family ATPase [Mycobacteriales bacterium]|nr:AAA family ATPase [Mycobacteriales bacterium]